MKQFKFYALVLLGIMLSINHVWADISPDVTVSFTTATNWKYSTNTAVPTNSTNGLTSSQTIKNGTYNLVVTPAGSGNKWYFNNYSGSYSLFFGKNGATLSLPTFSFAMDAITVNLGAQCSSSVTFNLYVGDTKLKATDATGSNNGVVEFKIPSGKQAAGTQYVLKITNANNIQIKSIDFYAASGSTYTDV